MKVWNGKECEKKPKDVGVKLEEMSLRAIDAATGLHVCFLFDFGDMRPFPCSFTILKDCGYRTDFAEWSEKGEMIRMLEYLE